MKRIGLYIIICLIFSITSNVSAESHDVQAKYEISYNVPVFTGTINNNTIEINVDDYVLSFSSSLKNIQVVVIKVTEDVNSYASNFTNSEENYYVAFFKENKKIDNTNIKLSIKNNKVLNVYDNKCNLLDKGSENIVLNTNDYFINITDKMEEGHDYIITDVDNILSELPDITLTDSSVVELYNYKGIKIDNTSPLGTGYKIIVNDNGNINEYTTIVKGDITGDAKISLNDVTRLYHYYKGIEQMDDIFELAGDVAHNNIINLNDITKIYHYYKGIISDL